jgi:hypothetical protein
VYLKNKNIEISIKSNKLIKNINKINGKFCLVSPNKKKSKKENIKLFLWKNFSPVSFLSKRKKINEKHLKHTRRKQNKIMMYEQCIQT